MKWYHEWQENARNRYLEGYYPGHKRVPNFIVLSLYGIGYFIGDFVPLILNLINGVYWAIKRLIAFVVGLLVEASIFVVLAGSVVFSVAHSIEQLRKVGATGGLEYVGVLMFEVIFIGSAATLTGFLMKKKMPRGFIEWFGLSFTILGFFVGLVFVWWANIHGMKPTLEGRIIGSAVPLLVIIGEGILAYRFIIENKEEMAFTEFIRRNQLSTDEVKAVIERYVQKKRKEALSEKENNVQKGSNTQEKAIEKTIENNDQISIEINHENGTETNRETADEIVEEMGAKVDIDIVRNPAEKSDEKAGVISGAQMDTKAGGQAVTQGAKMSTETGGKTDIKVDENGAHTDAESGAKLDTQADEKTDVQAGVEVDGKTDGNEDTWTGAKTDAQVDTKAGTKPGENADTQSGAEADAQTGVEPDGKVDTEMDAEPDTRPDADDGAKVGTKSDADDGVKVDAQVSKKTGAKVKKTRTKKSTANTDPEFKKVKRWAKKFQREKGKVPGRVEIQKKFEFGKSLSSKYAAMLKEELEDKAS